MHYAFCSQTFFKHSYKLIVRKRFNFLSHGVAPAVNLCQEKKTKKKKNTNRRRLIENVIFMTFNHFCIIFFNKVD